MEWNNKTLIKLTVVAREGGSTKLVSGGKEKDITLKKGEKLEISW